MALVFHQPHEVFARPSLAPPSLLIGNLSEPEGLWSTLEAICAAPPASPTSILIVYSSNCRGRIGVLENRILTGAVVDGTGEAGLPALQKLLSIRSGIYGFRDCFSVEERILIQGCNVDISKIQSIGLSGNYETPAEALIAMVSHTVPDDAPPIAPPTTPPIAQPIEDVGPVSPPIEIPDFSSYYMDLDVGPKPRNAKGFIKRAVHEEECTDGKRKLENWQLLLITMFSFAFIAFLFYAYREINRDQLLISGITQLKNNDPERAIVTMNELVQSYPDYGRGYFYRALVYANLGQPDKSVNDLDHAMFNGMSKHQVLIMRASIDLQTHNYEKVIEDCTTALLGDAKSGEAYQLRALAHNKLGNFDLAVNDASMALSLSPNEIAKNRLYRERGMAKCDLHDYDGAIADLDQAINARANESAFLKRAAAYMQQREFAKAKDDFTKVLQLDPGSYSACVGRAVAWKQLKGNQEALADLNRAVQLNSVGIEALMQRGLVFLNGGQYQLAADDFEKVLQINPYQRDVRQKYELASSHVIKPQAPRMKLEDDAASSAIRFPKSMPALMQLGYKYLAGNSAENAIACFAEAVRRQPGNADARKYLAYAFAEQGDAGDAAAQLQSLNVIRPLEPKDTFMLARMLDRSGQSRGAINTLSELLIKQPDCLQAEAELARLSLANGDTLRAADLCRDGLKKAKTPAEKQIFQGILLVSAR